MGYSTGLLRERVTILNRGEAASTPWGRDGGGVAWHEAGTYWASVDYVKGLRALREGALDVYGTVLVRMRWNGAVGPRSRILHAGRLYVVLGETFHADRQANTIQFNAQAVVGED